MATIREVVLGLRDALTAVVPDIARVYVVAKRPAKMPALVGDRDVFLRPGGFTVSSVDGTGRTDTRVRRRVDIILRSRMAVDSINQDLQLLTKDALGHFAYEDAVFDVFQMWMGNIADQATDDTMLLVSEGEPVRVTGCSDAERDFQSADGKWASSMLTIEVVYRQTLTVREYE